MRRAIECGCVNWFWKLSTIRYFAAKTQNGFSFKITANLESIIMIIAITIRKMNLHVFPGCFTCNVYRYDIFVLTSNKRREAKNKEFQFQFYTCPNFCSVLMPAIYTLKRDEQANWWESTRMDNGRERGENKCIAINSGSQYYVIK